MPPAEPDLLLIVPAWPERALLRAELIERGYDIVALESWQDADRLLLERRIRPRAAVVEMEGEQDAARLSLLVSALDRDRILVLTSAAGVPAETLRSLGFQRVLSRPFRIGDVVEVTRTMLAPPPANVKESP